MPLLGLSVGKSTVRAVVVRRGLVVWAGSAGYADLPDLADAIARLAGEAGPRLHRVRVGLERGMVQLRTLTPVPRMHADAARRHVALQADRLFRNGHSPLVTGASMRDTAGQSALLAAAALDELTRQVASGCRQAGLALESIAPAAEVLPAAAACPIARLPHHLTLPCGDGWEQLDLDRGRVWRSRSVAAPEHPVALAPGLGVLGEQAPAYATAFAAASGRARLTLCSRDAAVVTAARRVTRVRRLVIAAAAAWLAALLVLALRVAVVERRAGEQLAELGPALAIAVGVRRDLTAARGALETLDRARASRSQSLRLLDRLTRSLSDSVSLVSLRFGRDSILRLGGYAPVADGVVAALQRAQGFRAPRLEAPATRQLVPTGQSSAERDRFALITRVGAP